VDRRRFNKLLENPSLIENEDIRALNEYRKKYPFFQGLYVIVAKALVDRNHPKADAFIKKAAIYSAHRGYLKHIIEDKDFFKDQEKVEHQEVEEVEDSIKNTSQDPSIASKERPIDDVVKEDTEEVQQAQPKEKKEDPSASEKMKPEQPKAMEQKRTEETSPSDDHRLDEIQASKARIEAMLRGETPTTPEEPKTDSNPVQTSTAFEESEPTSHQGNEQPLTVVQENDPKQQKQIELIEKFIAEDPRIDVKKKALHEADQHQEDLASKNMKSAQDFETETIAKLMLQQGKVKKALAIYEKLRLKFPEKSAYFADQIESVKSKHND